jgi:hypothetical protein
MRRLAVAGLIVSLFSAMLSAMPAQAASTRITETDVKQVFQGVGQADFFGSRGAISPLSGTPWDGAHFCAEDWHVILLRFSEVSDASLTKRDAELIFSRVTVSFVLDGAALPSTRTAIKRLDFGAEQGWYFTQGRIMSPADLSVGQHTLNVTTSIPEDAFEDGITFFIDPTGTGACL